MYSYSMYSFTWSPAHTLQLLLQPHVATIAAATVVKHSVIYLNFI